MKELSKEELRKIAWRNAIINGSYGHNMGKYFLLFSDGEVSGPLDYTMVGCDGWNESIAQVDYENAFDYFDSDSYAHEIGIGKSVSNLTKAEAEEFINHVANNPPDSFKLEDDNVWVRQVLKENNEECPIGHHMVKGYKRKDGTGVKEHCARDPDKRKKMDRLTMKELKEISELDFAIAILNERSMGLNSYAPLNKKINATIKKLESLKK
jgi:hypothetical protein